MNKGGDLVVAIVILLLILIPSSLEMDFIVKLYRSSPALFMLGIAAVVTGGGIALWLRHSHPGG